MKTSFPSNGTSQEDQLQSVPMDHRHGCTSLLCCLNSSGNKCGETVDFSPLAPLDCLFFFPSRFSSFPDAAQAPMLFLGHPDRLLIRIPTSGEPIIFPCKKRVLPFILEIITQRQCEGELCTQGLPAARRI